MQIKILVGCSGAGKSTYAKNIKADFIFSADDYFMINGEYKFDAKRLGDAHAACLRKFVYLVGSEVDPKKPATPNTVVVVDNTNTTVQEIAPYAAVASAFGHDVEIVFFKVDPTVAATRNVHGVPVKKVAEMCERVERVQKSLPKWWKRTSVDTNPPKK